MSCLFIHLFIYWENVNNSPLGILLKRGFPTIEELLLFLSTCRDLTLEVSWTGRILDV